MPKAAPQPASTHAEDELRLADFDAAGRAALDAIVRALNETDVAVLALAEMLGVPRDLLMATAASTAPVATALRRVARQLVRRALAPKPGSDEALSVARELLDAAREDWQASARTDLPELPATLLRELRADVLGDVDELVREIGLAEFDTDIRVMTRRETDDPVLAWAAVPGETATVLLLSRLYPRLEVAASADALLALERGASHWFFQRWSARPGEDTYFPWSVREQEFSFVGRDTLALGVPVLSGYMREPLFAEMPALLQRLAEALDASFASIFTVREARDDRLLLEDMVTGEKHRVHEHNPNPAVRAGMLAFGRLIPWEDDLCLRSPGMALLGLAGAEVPREAIVRAIVGGEEAVGREVAVEGLLAQLSGRRSARVPATLAPAGSARKAAELLDEFWKLMEAYGLMEAPPAAEVPTELRTGVQQPAGQELRFFRIPGDPVIGDFVAALQEQARPALKPRGRAGGKKQKSKQAKKRKRR